MSAPGTARAAFALGLGLLLLSSFAGCRRAGPVLTPAQSAMGVYRGRILTESGNSRRFRLLLFAVRPDRLHAEIVSPIGGTELIVDGGGGMLAVSVVRDRVAYVGPSGREALDRIFGIPLSVEELVQVLHGGTVSPERTHTVRRLEQGPRPGLPRLIELHGAGNVLSLDLRKLRAVERPGDLGRGRPPPGLAVSPLERLTDVAASEPLAGEAGP